MFSRPRLWLIALGAVFILVLAWVLLHAPPDGIEHESSVSFVDAFIRSSFIFRLHFCYSSRFWKVSASSPMESSARIGGFCSPPLFHQRLRRGLPRLASRLERWLRRKTRYQSHVGGFSLAVALFLCCLLRLWDIRAYRIALLATLALLIWTSDKGGKLTHGESFMTRHIAGHFAFIAPCASHVKRKSGRQSKRREQLSQTPTSWHLLPQPFLCSASRSCL